jgi:hypothetical protein
MIERRRATSGSYFLVPPLVAEAGAVAAGFLDHRAVAGVVVAVGEAVDEGPCALGVDEAGEPVRVIVKMGGQAGVAVLLADAAVDGVVGEAGPFSLGIDQTGEAVVGVVDAADPAAVGVDEPRAQDAVSAFQLAEQSSALGPEVEHHSRSVSS